MPMSYLKERSDVADHAGIYADITTSNTSELTAAAGVHRCHVATATMILDSIVISHHVPRASSAMLAGPAAATGAFPGIKAINMPKQWLLEGRWERFHFDNAAADLASPLR
jgi:hypothetical protein